MYSIDENGDTTLTDYGLYTIKDGLPTFDKVIKAQSSSYPAGVISSCKMRGGSCKTRPSSV